MKPVCFVIMPFGKKKDSNGKSIDFDIIYREFIYPAIEAAKMEPIRADEETLNGIIHKPMYERLILCDYAVGDLTTSNANVLYELGIRHAVKPFSTINVYASGSKLPFDINGVRCMPYTYHQTKGLTKKQFDIESLTKKLKDARRRKETDSPVYQLVDGISFQNSVAHQKTDIFREQVEYNMKMKNLLKKTRENKKRTKEEAITELDNIVSSKIDIENEEAGVLIDVMLSYRSLNAFDKMISFIESMPSHVENTVMVQEQLGFALNRIGEKDQAIRVLESVIKQNGPSSETYGILGRVYKDKYDLAIKEKNQLKANGFLDKAIETYEKGFEADWRDAYPGINLLTLLEIKGNREKIGQLAPVVAYAVERKLASKNPDYWDYATLLEVGVISNDEAKANENLQKAMTCEIEGWMLETTINTLELLSKKRQERKENTAVASTTLEALKIQLANFNSYTY
jgi:tetratricopeptide (TPR) repeat protein